MRKYFIVAAVIPALLIAGAAVAYQGSDSAGSANQQTQNVTVDTFELTEDQISEIASGYENLYASEPVVIIVNGTTVELDPVEAGIEVDEQALAAQQSRWQPTLRPRLTRYGGSLPGDPAV
jgi:uncharacterized membrane protein